MRLQRDSLRSPAETKLFRILLGTVGRKLSLALVALVAGALAIVYVAVVPTLEDRLVDGRIDQLARTANAIIASTPGR